MNYIKKLEKREESMEKKADEQICYTCQQKRKCESYAFDFIGMHPVCGSCRNEHDEERAEEKEEREAEEERYENDNYYY